MSRLTPANITIITHVTDGHDLSAVIGYAGTGKSAMLGVARGAALSGIAAENLEADVSHTMKALAGAKGSVSRSNKLTEPVKKPDTSEVIGDNMTLGQTRNASGYTS